MKNSLISFTPASIRRAILVAGSLAMSFGLTVQAQDADADQTALVMDSLVVTASGFEQRWIEAPASISVVSPEEIAENRINNIADVLRGMEGVDIDSTFGKTGTPTISIRGMPSDYTLVLVDGRRQNVAGNVTPNGFGETANAFLPPAVAIERVEVVRGPMSTLYGSDAIGGVINIITKKIGDTWGGTLTADTTIQEDSDYGARHGVNLYLSGPLVANKLGLTLRSSYIRRQASDLSATADDGTTFSINDSNYVPGWAGSRGFSPADGDIWNFGTHLNFIATEAHDFWFDADWARQAYDNSNQGLGTLDYGPSAPTSARGYKDELRFNREQYSVGWNGRFDRGTLDTNLMINTTETFGRSIPNGTFPATNPIQPGDPRILNNENIVLNTKFVAPIGLNHTTTLGAQIWKAEMQDGIASDATTGEPVTFAGTQWSLFAEDAWRLSSDVTFTFGLRYDNHDVVGDNLSPRAYVVYNPHENWTIKGGVSQGFKTPALNDFYNGVNGVSGQGTIFSYGNPNLKPETSTSYELGAVFNNRNGLTFGVTGFATSFQDKLGSEPNPNVPGANWDANIDEAESFGFESFVKYNFSDSWTLGANYTWLESEYKGGANDGESFVNTPKHSINTHLRWRTNENLSFWLSGEYRSERYRGTDTRGVSASLGDFRAYSLFHLGTTWKLSEQVSVNATIYNLLDQDFIEYDTYFDTRENADRYSSTYANLYERRRLWLSMSYSF